MIVAVRFTVEHDEAGDVYKIRNLEAPLCPDCGRLMSGYDTRRRHVIDSSGAVYWFLLRRFLCPHCQKLHLELPSFMQAKKHYDARLIEAVLAGRSDSCPADNSTIRRWRKK